MFCKECGKQLGSSDKFCPECGTKVVVEKPKPALEPMFFVEKREEPVVEKKPKRVIHLDEFNWDLDGYPTEKRKTEAVDFNWASVLEDKVRQASPKPVEVNPEPKEEKPEPLGHMPKTVEELLAALPDNVQEIIEEPDPVTEEDAIEEGAVIEETPVIEIVEESPVTEEPAEPAVEEAQEKEIEVKSLEQIIEDFGAGPMDEPTRLIDKAQMKADSVESFYVFSKKQAEYQTLLDQEYDKIQSSLQEPEEDEGPTPTVEEILEGLQLEDIEPVASADAMEDAVSEETEELAEPTPKAEEPAPVPEVKELELVAIAWSMPPAGIIVEKQAPKTAGKDTLMQEAKVLMAELEKLMPEGVEPDHEEAVEIAETETVETSTETIEPQVAEEAAAEVPAEDSAVEETKKEPLTFADIFNDEDDEDEVKNGGGCLKFIAIVLMILVVIELGILGIPHFAKDSEAAQFINEAYGKVINLVMGNEEPETPVVDVPSEPTEIEMLITAQKEKNQNIAEIVENPALVFEAGQDYGYEELPDTYAFMNSPWYENEEGKEVTYGDEIVGTLIQYYSALPDKINDVNKDVLDYVDNTTALYEELDAMEGEDARGYMVNRLEIGEIRTGQKGFYAIVNVTAADKLQPEQTQQKQLVYLEANPSKKVIKIRETKNI